MRALPVKFFDSFDVLKWLRNSLAFELSKFLKWLFSRFSSRSSSGLSLFKVWKSFLSVFRVKNNSLWMIANRSAIALNSFFLSGVLNAWASSGKSLHDYAITRKRLVDADRVIQNAYDNLKARWICVFAYKFILNSPLLIKSTWPRLRS